MRGNAAEKRRGEGEMCTQTNIQAYIASIKCFLCDTDLGGKYDGSLAEASGCSRGLRLTI